MNLSRDLDKDLPRDLRIIVLSGGISDEREVSLRSGKNIFETLKKQNFVNVELFSFQEKEALINFLIEKKQRIDIVYNILHGSFGEDGQVQGLLNSFSIPYTGEGVLASSIAFDKLKTKEILKSKMINTAPFYSFYHLQDNFSQKQFFSDLLAMNFNYPFFFKKSQSGSSRGVIKINSKQEMEKILEDKSIIVNISEYFIEKEIKGREITVAIGRTRTTKGNSISVLPILEIIPSVDFYDYKAKYQEGMTELKVVELEEEIYNGVISAAKRIYQTFHFEGWVRIDFMLNSEGSCYVLEINTQPGMTQTSDIPKMLHKSNFSLAQFIEMQLKLVIY